MEWRLARIVADRGVGRLREKIGGSVNMTVLDADGEGGEAVGVARVAQDAVQIQLERVLTLRLVERAAELAEALVALSANLTGLEGRRGRYGEIAVT